MSVGLIRMYSVCLHALTAVHCTAKHLCSCTMQIICCLFTNRRPVSVRVIGGSLLEVASQHGFHTGWDRLVSFMTLPMSMWQSTGVHLYMYLRMYGMCVRISFSKCVCVCVWVCFQFSCHQAVYIHIYVINFCPPLFLFLSLSLSLSLSMLYQNSDPLRSTKYKYVFFLLSMWALHKFVPLYCIYTEVQGAVSVQKSKCIKHTYMSMCSAPPFLPTVHHTCRDHNHNTASKATTCH